MLQLYQYFLIATIFLDRNGPWRCRTMEEKNGLPSSIKQRKVMNVNFFVFVPYLQDHGFLLPWQNSGLLSGTHFTATLGGGRAGSFTTRAFFLGFHFYQKPILTSPPAELNFRYRGHGEASINDISWSRWLCFNPCRKNFC